MEPRSPDPISTAQNLQDIPARVLSMSAAFKKANEQARCFPAWREYQILAFIRYSGVYAEDLSEAYRRERVDLLAQAMRNLMELNIWTRFCAMSEANAKRFFDDATRDLKEMLEVAQIVYTNVNREANQTLDALLTDLRGSAARFNIEDFDGQYTRVNDAARIVGVQFGHAKLYKVASKLAHPTALLLRIIQPEQDLRDSLYEGGAKLVDACLVKTENCIKTEYPSFEH